MNTQCFEVPMTQIQTNLYLGGIKEAFDLGFLKQNKITHILNITKEVPNYFPDNFQYKCVRISDKQDVRIDAFFDEMTEFILEGVQTGNVLVHCVCGVSRSSTAVAAFLVKHRNFRPCEAISYIRKRRTIANPNPGFVKQLYEFYEKLQTQNRQNATVIGLNQIDLKSAREENIQSSSGKHKRDLSITKVEKDLNDLTIQFSKPRVSSLSHRNKSTSTSQKCPNTEDKSRSKCLEENGLAQPEM